MDLPEAFIANIAQYWSYQRRISAGSIAPPVTFQDARRRGDVPGLERARVAGIGCRFFGLFGPVDGISFMLLLLCWNVFCNHLAKFTPTIAGYQTKIWEGRTNVSECVFEATLCSPNEDFGSPNQPFRMCFPGSTFQRFFAQIEYSHPLKRASRETHSERLVRPSKIFVWDGKLYAPQTKILEGGTKEEMRIFDGAFNDS
jgi:hypothetical protein